MRTIIEQDGRRWNVVPLDADGRRIAENTVVCRSLARAEEVAERFAREEAAAAEGIDPEYA